MQSNPTSLRSILISSSHLRLTSFDFPSGFTHQKPCLHLPSHPCYMPCPSHVPWSGTLIIFSKEYKSCSSSLCTLLQNPVTSSLFCLIIFYSAGVWSMLSALHLFSFPTAISISKAIGLGISGWTVCVSVCLTSLTPCTITSWYNPACMAPVNNWK